MSYRTGRSNIVVNVGGETQAPSTSTGTRGGGGGQTGGQKHAPGSHSFKQANTELGGASGYNSVNHYDHPAAKVHETFEKHGFRKQSPGDENHNPRAIKEKGGKAVSQYHSTKTGKLHLVTTNTRRLILNDVYGSTVDTNPLSKNPRGGMETNPSGKAAPRKGVARPKGRTYGTAPAQAGQARVTRAGYVSPQT
jgi:hypothetical protein